MELAIREGTWFAILDSRSPSVSADYEERLDVSFQAMLPNSDRARVSACSSARRTGKRIPLGFLAY